MTAHTKSYEFTNKGRKAPALASLAVSEEVIDRLSREAGLRFDAQRDTLRHHLSPGLLDPVEPAGRSGLVEWCMLVTRLLGAPERKRPSPRAAHF